jgi:hypothetical protein
MIEWDSGAGEWSLAIAQGWPDASVGRDVPRAVLHMALGTENVPHVCVAMLTAWVVFS